MVYNWKTDWSLWLTDPISEIWYFWTLQSREHYQILWNVISYAAISSWLHNVRAVCSQNAATALKVMHLFFMQVCCDWNKTHHQRPPDKIHRKALRRDLLLIGHPRIMTFQVVASTLYGLHVSFTTRFQRSWRFWIATLRRSTSTTLDTWIDQGTWIPGPWGSNHPKRVLWPIDTYRFYRATAGFGWCGWWCYR